MNWRKPDENADFKDLPIIRQGDYAIVGLGYAGTAAFRALAERGMDVVGIEASEEARFRLFGRDVGHINSEFLQSRGIPAVDPIEVFNEWMRRAGNRANPKLIMKYCQKSGQAFDWFTEPCDLDDVHVAFWPLGGEAYHRAAAEGNGAINGYHFWLGTAEFPDPMGWEGTPQLYECAKKNNLSRIETLIRDTKAAPDHKLEITLPPPIRKKMTVYCGRTPDELAANAGLIGETADTLAASIHRYNEICESGRDTDFGRDSRLLDPLTDTLFLYATETQPMGQMLVTVGGLVTDENQNVLDGKYDPIAGLYATGNCCGRRFGPQYSTPISGVSIGICITLGRELGNHLGKNC